MSEPKKETVRIVLPPRRDGQPSSSNPRETAMINLPSKPAPLTPSSISVPPPPAPVAPSTPPAPPVSSSPPPAPPGIKPASIAPMAPPTPGGVLPPKPPSVPGLKPPVMPPASSAAPKVPGSISAPKPPMPKGPVSVSAPAPTAPPKPSASISAKPVSLAPGIAPAPLKTDTKKETAKVPPSAGGKVGLPQATVQFSAKPNPSKSVSASRIVVAPGDTKPAGTGEISPILGGLAAAASFAALAVQIWFLL